MIGVQVAQALERAKVERGGLPASITVDNGTDFSRRALDVWVMTNDVQLCFIRPGRPVENEFIERFNGRLRDECLNVGWLVSLADARQKLARFREHYNHERLHGALADRTPAGFAELYRDVSAKASTSISSGPTGSQGLALVSIGGHDTRTLGVGRIGMVGTRLKGLQPLGEKNTRFLARWGSPQLRHSSKWCRKQQCCRYRLWSRPGCC